MKKLLKLVLSAVLLLSITGCASDIQSPTSINQDTFTTKTTSTPVLQQSATIKNQSSITVPSAIATSATKANVSTKSANVAKTSPQEVVTSKPAVTKQQSSEETYTNSVGNTVKSPTYSDTVPAGATAKCKDGTYSFSKSRSGTCSRHGGVASFL